MRSAAVVTLVLLTLGAPVAAAGAEDTGSVTDVAASVEGTTLTVTGRASFADARNAEVGTDAPGDALHAGLGSDMTSARIARADGSTLRFTLAIADPMPVVFTLPEIVHYHWQIAVTHQGVSRHFQLQAMRSGQYGRTFPNADPLFRVNACGATASGAPLCFHDIGFVPGVMADGVVQWDVPTALIGAFVGAVVAPGPSGIKVQPGASAAAYGGRNLDELTNAAAYVVGPAVSVGVQLPGASAGAFLSRTDATLGPDGTFAAKLRAPAADRDHVVTVSACDGHAGSCGIVRVPLPAR